MGIAFSVTALSEIAAGYMPAFLDTTAWTIILATIVGIIAAMTPLGLIPGAVQVSNVLLYMLIALIAANADFTELTQAPAYILAGFVILGIHGLIMTGVAKIFKLDSFTCGVASLSNIGGVASAPVLVAAYSQSLVPVAVLTALIGVITGTFMGIGVGTILGMM